MDDIVGSMDLLFIEYFYVMWRHMLGYIFFVVMHDQLELQLLDSDFFVGSYSRYGYILLFLWIFKWTLWLLVSKDQFNL